MLLKCGFYHQVSFCPLLVSVLVCGVDPHCIETHRRSVQAHLTERHSRVVPVCRGSPVFVEENPEAVESRPRRTRPHLCPENSRFTMTPFTPCIKMCFRWPDCNRVVLDRHDGTGVRPRHIEHWLWSDRSNHVRRCSGMHCEHTEHTCKRSCVVSPTLTAVGRNTWPCVVFCRAP